MKFVKNFMNRKYDNTVHQTLLLLAGMFLAGNWVVREQESWLLVSFWVLIVLSFIENSRKKKE